MKRILIPASLAAAFITGAVLTICAQALAEDFRATVGKYGAMTVVCVPPWDATDSEGQIHHFPPP